MKRRKIYLFVITAGCFALLSLAGCKKHFDEIKICNIHKITVYDPTYPVVGSFAYNAHGNPVSVSFDHIAESRPNYEFRYDAYQRLTDFIRLSDNGFFETWTKYYYDSHNRVVSDSIFIFGHTGPFPTGYSDSSVGKYEYDPQGRISKYIYTFLTIDPSNLVYNYSYDASGNLVRPGITYDDKISIYRTNKVWMFIHRNYSRDNAFIAEAYNSFGLPTQIRPTGVVKGYDNEPRFIDQPLRDADIEYICR